MFKLKFNELEKRRLLSYAGHSMRDQLHWGDGEIIIPEEQILQQKITDAEDKLTLNFEQLELLTNWFLDATDEGILLLGEDISILNKIIGQLTPYHNELKRKYDVKLRMLKAQIDAAEKVHTKLTRIVPKTEEKVIVEGTQNETVLNEKIEKISQERREVEEYKKELTNKFQEERVDKQHEEIGEQRIELEEEQKEAKFEGKVKRAKELREEMQKADKVAKKVKKKARGKKLF